MHLFIDFFSCVRRAPTVFRGFGVTVLLTAAVPLRAVIDAPVSPNAQPGVAKLLNFLDGIQGNSTLAGQQESMDWAGVSNEPQFNAIQASTGKLPAVRGLDFIFNTYTGNNYRTVADNGIAWARRGGIVTLCCHMFMDIGSPAGNPQFYVPSANNGTGTTFDIRQAVITGTPENIEYLAKLDILANELKKLRDAGVPVIWRPFHECSGGWFWWGAHGATPLKQAWRIMFDRFTNIHNLTNLIWCFNPTDPIATNLPDWYPGDDVVDMISNDVYPTAGTHPSFATAYKQMRDFKAGRKVVTMSENGAIPDPDTMFSEGAGWAYFCTWNGFETNAAQNSAAFMTKVYNHAKVITLDELPALYVAFPLAFTAQPPATMTVAPGQSATFTIATSGFPTPTLQWQRLAAGSIAWTNLSNGGSYAGATTATLTVSNTTAGMSGDQFRCIATNPAGSISCNTATLVTQQAPTITTHPISQTSATGNRVAFNAVASGNPAPTYQWQKDGVTIAGATTSSYAISNVTASDAGIYRMIATNTAGTATSNPATLTVAIVPVFTTQPLSQPAFVGTTVNIVAVASSSNPITYQWQKGGVAIPGATNPTLTIPNAQLSDASSYAVIATDSGGAATSRFARLVMLVSQQNAITYATTVSSTAVTAGGIVNSDYFMTNVGTKTWGANHYLSIRDASGTFVAFSPLIGILPGETTTATLRFPAPTAAGTYIYYVQALENGVEFFSTQTTVTLTVLAPLTNSITYNTTSFPVSAAPGSAIIFTYNVTNTGAQTWGARHNLSLKDSNGTTLSTAPLTVLVPGSSKTVNLSFTAPATPGTYAYTVQASQTGVGNFDTQANLTLVVLAPRPNAIVYHPIRYPDAVAPGATLNLKYTLSNAGTQAWSTGHYVSLRDANENYLAFIPLGGTDMAASKTVDFTFSAPTTPGTYTYYVQALEDGIEFFSTQDVVIVTVDALPLGNAVSYNTSTFPVTASPGASVSFTANVTNRGTRTWSAKHYLSFRDVDNVFLAFPSVNGVTPGASTTATLNFTAPLMPGIYTYKLQAFEDGIAFFDMADTVVLSVQ